MARRSCNTGMGAMGRGAYMRTVNINTMRGLGFMGDDYDYSQEDAFYAAQIAAPDSYNDPRYEQPSNPVGMPGGVTYATNPVRTQVLPNGQVVYTPAGNGALVQTAGSAGPGTSAYGTGTIMDAFKGLLQQAPAITSTVVGVQNMQRIQEMNAALVAQGRPPLTSAQITAMTTPVSVGLAPNTMNMLMIGGIALIAVMALKKS